MSLKAGDLRALHETALYPGLLARIVGSSPAHAAEIPPATVLLDVLDPELSVEETGDGRFQQLVEDGEIGAAQALRDLLKIPDADAQLIRVKARLEQRVQQQLHRVMGLLLILKDTQDPRRSELDAQFERLKNDGYMRDRRPGCLLRRLEPIEQRLEALIADGMERVRRQYDTLRTSLRPANQQDLGLALRRLEPLLGSSETLPAAQRLVVMAQRARDGHLNPEDLRLLHKEGVRRGRLIRSRSDFPREVRLAADVLRFLDNDKPATFASEFEREKTRELFRALIPSGGVLDNTAGIARRLLTFLGLPAELPRDFYKGSLGSSFRIHLSTPRVPALRTAERTFRHGIQLVVPLRIDDTTIPPLLQGAPREALRFVYFPGRLDRNPRHAFASDTDVALFDHIDLLRLGECSQEQRAHAFQQVILPRLPLRRFRPYQVGGAVAPEMFRGRRDKIERLKQAKGGTVLFSGRMMGKSSILTKIDVDIQAQRTRNGAPGEVSVFVSSATEDLLTPLVTKLVGAVGGDAGRKFAAVDRTNTPSPNLRPKERRERTQRFFYRVSPSQAID